MAEVASDSVVPLIPAKKIRVKVYQSEGYGSRIWSVEIAILTTNSTDPRGYVSNALNPPPPAIVKAFLPPNCKKYMSGRGRYGTSAIREALNQGCPPQAMHDALKAWAFSVHGNNNTSVESESSVELDEQKALLRIQPATMIVGGKVYRLVPTGEADATSLIKKIRKQAIEVSKVESKLIIDKAGIDGRMIISQAQEEVANMQVKVNSLRRELGQMPPNWLVDSHRPILKRTDSRWAVQLSLSPWIREIRFTIPYWDNTVLFWDPLRPHNEEFYKDGRMPAWVVIGSEGAYSIQSVYMTTWVTTHIGRTGCMELQNMPARLQSLNDLMNLERAVNRGIQVVNLNSPLQTDTQNYWPEFREQLPPTVISLLRRDISIDPSHGTTMEAYFNARPTLRPNRTETARAEQAMVFSVAGAEREEV
jgi:hypothetical protein